MNNLYLQIPWMEEVLRILIYFASAWLIAFFMKQLARRVVRFGQLAPNGHKPSLPRQQTLQSLLSSSINLLMLIIAVLASLGLFIKPDTLAWMIGEVTFTWFYAASGLSLMKHWISNFQSWTFSWEQIISLPIMNSRWQQLIRFGNFVRGTSVT